jgi:hypothetical protein
MIDGVWVEVPGVPATPAGVYDEYFIAGTAPTEYCNVHGQPADEPFPGAVATTGTMRP